ncbi:MAG: hypothetical protein R2877_04960 [Bdellovibrionota bacterium]
MKKFLSAFVILFSLTIQAHDGDHCENPFFQSQHGITTAVRGTFGQHQILSQDFDYFITDVELGYAYKNIFFTSLRVPFVSLETSGQREFRLSDIHWTTQTSLLRWDGINFLSLGLNTEFPSGNENHFVGNGHLDFRPYVGFQQKIGTLITYGQLGYAFATSRHEDVLENHTPGDEHSIEEHIYGSVVDVHSEREATFQLGATTEIMESLFINTSVAGQTVLTNQNAKMWDFYMTVNPALTLIMLDNLTLTMFTQIPVTTLKRFDYRFGTGINYIF